MNIVDQANAAYMKHVANASVAKALAFFAPSEADMRAFRALWCLDWIRQNDDAMRKAHDDAINKLTGVELDGLDQ